MEIVQPDLGIFEKHDHKRSQTVSRNRGQYGDNFFNDFHMALCCYNAFCLERVSVYLTSVSSKTKAQNSSQIIERQKGIYAIT